MSRQLNLYDTLSRHASLIFWPLLGRELPLIGLLVLWMLRLVSYTLLRELLVEEL